ncbi:P-loop NTPase family protein [Companilactobacillus jidongensis]|uniref:CRISPR-associated protein Csn2-St n=1 Tax=Companilactobacillus jidongensis TaxID=2486006 RepID=UPI000F797B00|nr:CRISPR-associated protein Csn2-St [Companilactobacillus jidongensis]
MILKIELENQKFLDIDFDDIVYLTGCNQKNLWKVFRSLYYYFNRTPSLSSNVYGDNNIEISLDDNKVSVKNTDVYFIHDRESIYNQMQYKKGTLLYDNLNSLSDDIEINHIIDELNDDNLKLEIEIQNYLKNYSNNLKVNFGDLNYLDMLKNFLLLNYEEDSLTYPLEFMDTESLLDEFLNFLEFKLKNNGNPTWIVMYNIGNIVSSVDEADFINALKLLMDNYDLKVIFIGNNLVNIPITVTEIGNIVVSAQDFHQLLPVDELFRSVKMRYPNELDIETLEFTECVKRIVSFVGNDEKVHISGKDLVLLKVVNEILNYETSYSLDDHLLTSAETKFLEN